MDAFRRDGVQRIVQVGADAIAVVLGDVGRDDRRTVARLDRRHSAIERRSLHLAFVAFALRNAATRSPPLPVGTIVGAGMSSARTRGA
jgi:hypothetical protein